MLVVFAAGNLDDLLTKIHHHNAIGELQDSLLPVEVGDTELRAGLSRTRELIAPLPAAAREMVRTLGR